MNFGQLQIFCAKTEVLESPPGRVSQFFPNLKLTCLLEIDPSKLEPFGPWVLGHVCELCGNTTLKFHVDTENDGPKNAISISKNCKF